MFHKYNSFTNSLTPTDQLSAYVPDVRNMNIRFRILHSRLYFVCCFFIRVLVLNKQQIIFLLLHNQKVVNPVEQDQIPMEVLQVVK